MLIGTFLTSCYTEQSIGKHYGRSVAKEQPPLWFVGASFLFNECLIPSDTAVNGCIMTKPYSDSLLLEEYNSAFAQRLSEYGFVVYNYAEADSFLARSTGGWIVNIAQLEFEEDGDIFTDTEVYNELEYYESFPIRVIRLHSWMEALHVDTIETLRSTYYTMADASDIVEGDFQRSGLGSSDLTYSYTRYDMRPSLTPMFFRQLGADHAGRLFDTWMNNHIKQHFSDSGKVGIYFQEYVDYWTFDLTRRRAVPSVPERTLILMEK